MSAIKIESGIPVPPPQWRGAPKSEVRLAMEAMKPGQSFQVSRKAYKLTRLFTMARASGIKIVTRQVNCEGLRIWRVQ